MNVLRLVKRLHGVLNGEACGHHASIKSGKKGKTTQQHGQIRLSETIFKIWVRVQAITSLSLTIPLCSLLCTSLFLHLTPLLLLLSHPLLHTQLYLLTHFTYPNVFISFSPSTFLPPSALSFSLSICCAWHVLPEPSAEAAA